MECNLGLSLSKSLPAILISSLALTVLSACSSSFGKPLLDYLSPFKNKTQSQTATSVTPAPFVPPGIGPPPGGKLEVSLSEAIFTGLSNNKAFEVQKFKPPTTSLSESIERAAFDPVAKANLETQREKVDQISVGRNFKANTSVTEFLPTGTTIEVLLGTEYSSRLSPLNSTSTGAQETGLTLEDKAWKTVTSMSVNQALLKGAGIQTNLVNLRKARVDTQISMYELTGLAQALAAEIENAYWEYFLALMRVDIYERALALASRMLRETRQRISAGEKAASEIYFFQAEESSTRQTLQDAKSLQEKTRLRLLRMISPPSFDLWNRKLALLTRPNIPPDSVEEIASHIQVAMRMRPDINQARLEEQKGTLEIVKTKNGLLPKLDAFLQFGRTGYAKNFDLSVYDYGTGDGGLDYLARIQFEFPPLNRRATAEYSKSILDLAKSRDAIDNLVQLAQQEVLLAYVEIHRAKEQIRLSSNTVKYQLEKRDAEIEKYRLGTGSAFRVTQAERDTITSQLSAAQARIDYLKGLTAFYVADGSLLARRGIGTIFSGP